MRRQDGFTLIEILVVLAITSVTLIVLFEIYASGSQRLVANQSVGEAAIAAETKLAELDAAGGYEEGEQSGTTGDTLGWRVSIRPFTNASWKVEEGGPTVLDVTVTVFPQNAPDDPSFILRTQRLAEDATPR